MSETSTTTSPSTRRCPEPGCDNPRGEEFPFRCPSCQRRSERRTRRSNR